MNAAAACYKRYVKTYLASVVTLVGTLTPTKQHPADTETVRLVRTHLINVKWKAAKLLRIPFIDQTAGI